MKIIRLSLGDIRFSAYELSKQMALYSATLILTKHNKDYVAVISMKNFTILHEFAEKESLTILRLPLPLIIRTSYATKLVAVHGKTVILTKTRARNDDLFAIISLSNLLFLQNTIERNVITLPATERGGRRC